MSITVTLQPTDSTAVDNYLHSSISVPHGNDQLQIGHQLGTLVRTVFEWDLTSITGRAHRVMAATMTLYEHTDEVSTTQTARCYRVTEDNMTESATWSTYDGSNAWATAGGDFSTNIVGTATIASTGGNLVMSDDGFVDLVRDAIDNRHGYLRIIVATQEELDGVTTGTQRMKYHSSNALSSANHPKLEITYEHVVNWTGGAGDGNLGTASNWSTGSVPGAGERVLFATGTDDITLGSLTCGICCVGPGFGGAIGNPRALVLPQASLQITADVIVWQSATAMGDIESMDAAAVVYVMDSPAIAGDLVMSGVAGKVVVGRTRSTHTLDIDATTLEAFSGGGDTTRIIMGSTFSGNVHASGVSTRVELTTSAGDGGHLHAGGGARIETAESGTAGHVVVGSSGRVGFNASRLDAESAAWEQYAHVMASDAATDDKFGLSCAADGDTCVVGAGYDDDDGTDSGSAYVYVRSGMVWVQQAKLSGSLVSANHVFGRNVGISGDTIVTGAYYGYGEAYVFKRSGTTWTQEGVLSADDEATGDDFGHDVKVDGDTLVVGAPRDDDTNPSSGSAYVFIRPGNTGWNQQAKLTASDPGVAHEFGHSVDIAGDTVLVGCWHDDDGGIRAGSAYVFTRSGTTWTQEAKLTASDAATEDSFGTCARIDGDTAVISAPYKGSERGAVYVFTRSGTTWTQEAKLVPNDSNQGDYFGIGIDISGDTVAIGAYEDDDNGYQSGSVYVFTRSGTTWTQQTKVTPIPAAAGDNFGWSVSLNTEGEMLVGAPEASASGVAGGAAFWYWLTREESLVLDGRFDGEKNPNGDADVGGQLAVYHPGDAHTDSTTGGIGFANGPIRCNGGGLSVDSETTINVD